ncbi:MAG: LPS export ABC transporter periplasmic protein LptC [Candidatus Poribacteria bacterium]|nr:LPS export ABC transporter periplasmic protein LptC [Candidatus Poribacteria bacterium]
MITLVWALSFCLNPLSLSHEACAEESETTSAAQEQVESDAVDTSDDEEVIDGTADDMERDEKQGLTILIGNVRIKRPNGFLNADKVTIHEDVETGVTIKTVAEGNVEIRDQDMFATCEHAILNHTDDTVDLRDNVVVIQDADRLETKHFTFNRRTGKQTADGGVKFKVRMKRGKKSAEATAEEEEQSEEN